MRPTRSALRRWNRIDRTRATLNDGGAFRGRPLRAKVRRAVEAATVSTETGGCGVLVPGGYVLTATHCIQWDGTAGLVLGDHHPIAITTRDGAHFRLGPGFADAVTDMAALGDLDCQEASEDCDAFEAWRERIAPIPIRSLRPIPGVLTRAHVQWPDGEWGHAAVVNWSPHETAWGTLWLQTARPLVSGMSGGPIVDDDGRVLGVVSHGTKEGRMPLACAALPGWLMKRIKRACS
jgi:hypothetical protein